MHWFVSNLFISELHYSRSNHDFKVITSSFHLFKRIFLNYRTKIIYNIFRFYTKENPERGEAWQKRMGK